VVVIVALAPVLGVLGVFVFAAQIGQGMSQSLRLIPIRLMGTTLAAVSVGMIVTGPNALLPGLG